MAFTAPKIQDILIPDFQRVAHDAPVTSLYTALGKSKGVPALVFKGKDFAGLVTASELLRNVNASRTKVSTLLRKTPSLKFSDSLETAIHLMRDADVRVLPVMVRGNVVGIVRARDILKALIKHPVFDQVTASRLATLSPYSVSPNDDLGKALTIMRDNHVRKLAVTDARGLPVGLIKLEDLAGDILAKMDTGPDKYFRMGKDAQSISKPSPMSMKVAGIMEDLPVIVDPEARMRDVLKQMAKQNNPAVLVKHNMLIATQDVYNYYLAALLPQTLPIAISHLPDVDGIDQGFIEQTLERTFQKLMRVLKSDHHLHAVYKQVQKSGLRARTNVRLSLEGAGRSYHAEATDWKVRLATVEACKTIEKEVLRAFRSNSSRKNRAV